MYSHIVPYYHRIDLANLQFLMAVEDLLDNSNLVANALSEAASVDQVRLATQSFRNTLIDSAPSSTIAAPQFLGIAPNSNKQPMPSAQGSRESQSPPNETDTLPLLATTTTTTTNDSVNSEGEVTLSVPVVEKKHNENTTSGSGDAETVAVVTKEPGESPKKESSQLATEAARAGNEENLKRLEKISTSMSQVLDSLTRASGEDGNRDNNNDEEEDDDHYVDVAENNFLNDNHTNVLCEQEDYIAMLKRQEDADDDTIGEDDDGEDDDFDSDEFDDYDDVENDIVAASTSATIKSNDYVISASADITTPADVTTIADTASVIPTDPRIMPTTTTAQIQEPTTDKDATTTILPPSQDVASNETNTTTASTEDIKFNSAEISSQTSPGDIPRDVLASMLQVKLIMLESNSRFQQTLLFIYLDYSRTRIGYEVLLGYFSCRTNSLILENLKINRETVKIFIRILGNSFLKFLFYS